MYYVFDLSSRRARKRDSSFGLPFDIIICNLDFDWKESGPRLTECILGAILLHPWT
jgi:hypothetical protein